MYTYKSKSADTLIASQALDWRQHFGTFEKRENKASG